MSSKKKKSLKSPQNNNQQKNSNSSKNNDKSNASKNITNSLQNTSKKNDEKKEKVIKKDNNSKEENVVFKKEETVPKKEKSTVKKEEKNNLPQKVKEEKKEVLIEKENVKRKIGIIIILAICILVIILFFSTIFAMIHSTKNTIANGVKINNIDVSGLTYDEAKSKLDEAFKVLNDVNIDLKYEDYNYVIKPEDVEFKYNFKNQLDEAYSIGRNGNVLESNYSLLLTALMKKNIAVDYSYNTNDVDSIVEDVSTSIPGLVSQYSHYIEGDNLIIKPGVDGIKVDNEYLKKKIQNNFKNRDPLKIIRNYSNIDIDIPYKKVKADSIDIDKIYKEIYSEPKDAYFTPATETEKAKIFADVDGIDFAISIDEAKEKIKEKSDEYSIPLSRKKAAVTINEIGLEAFPTKLEEFSTRYDASNWGRSENLRIATSKIDGVVLMPGQQFSFNGVVGERTVQEGYKNAAIFAGDSVVDGLAGGICQISSTLYNAALLANLQIDERHNHSFKTSYLEVGRDATVVYGIKDLKFTNTRSYPIKIEGSAENGVVHFEIYGIEEDEEYKINISTDITSTIPYSVETVTDNSLAPGTQLISQAGSSGYRVTTYKEKVLNGTVVSNEEISSDIYKPMNRILKVGPSSGGDIEEGITEEVSIEE